ncbi:unnamed protein product [Brugia timori]|uniref:Uncharacterized protein n=1 Tax=Brugia timori TaxID=42155 RepID=A0A3P7T9N0_9BILA|nr:unnamed protein product [Brugia timori]
MITYLSPYLFLSPLAIYYVFRLFAQKVVESYFLSHMCYVLFLLQCQLCTWRMQLVSIVRFHQ